jgi:hypothetical protein
MAEMVEFTSDDGHAILVEVPDSTGRPVTRGGRGTDELVTRASDSLENVLGRLGPVVKGVVSQLRAAADRPDEVQVDFAVKISADSNVIIARASGEANFRINLKWVRPTDP